MRPGSTTQNAPDSPLRHAVLCGELPLADRARCVPSSKVEHCGLGQRSASVAFASRPGFRMKPGAVSVPASKALWMTARAVVLATSQAFGIFPSVVTVAAWTSLRMQAGRMIVTARRHLPAFRVSVGIVVGLGSQPQMGRITARRVVAVVTDAEAVGDWPVGNGPSDAVGATATYPEMDAAISGRVPTGRPLPTCVRPARRVDLGPEPCGCGIINHKHRNLDSGEPVGVSAPRRAFFVPPIIARAFVVEAWG